MKVKGYDDKLRYANEKLKELKEQLESDKQERIKNVIELENLKLKLR